MWTRSANDLRQRGQVSALLIARQATPHIDYGVRLVHPIEGGDFGGRKGLIFRNSRCKLIAPFSEGFIPFEKGSSAARTRDGSNSRSAASDQKREERHAHRRSGSRNPLA